MQRISNTLDIEIFGLKDLENISEFKNIKLPQIDESGKIIGRYKNAIENGFANFFKKVLEELK